MKARPTRSAWTWIPAHLIVTWHAKLMERYGGAVGIRDLALLEGALARPQSVEAYGDQVSIEKLAAFYGVAIAKAHAFVDGNERVAFAAMVTFLKANGAVLDVAEMDAASIMQRVADGSMTERQLEAWLKKSIRRD